ncbi:hypothetical protein FACS189468_3390 [Spirochaetia bacterium]|nr:hypothetical protein FACS189468_3390 [Spirochaetia bacterium]
MQEDQPLTDLLYRYHRGELSKKDLEGHIFQYIQKNTRRFNLYKWHRDECTDYLCWLYPRISGAIDHYQDEGSSFDAYIGALVRLSSREYRLRQTDRRIIEYTWWKTRAEEMMVHDEEPEYPECSGAFKQVSNPKQVLVLLLKSYFFLSEDFISRIAPAIEMEKEELRHMVNKMRKLRVNRDEEIRGLRERIHCQYYRCVTFEKRRLNAPEGSPEAERMTKILEKARGRHESMRKRLAAMRFEASNREIAEVMGVPKGTVDSNLYAAQQKRKDYGV